MCSTKQLPRYLALIAALLVGLWIPCRVQAQTKKMPKWLAETGAFVGAVAQKFGFNIGDSNEPNMDKVVIALDQYRREHPNASAAELKNAYQVFKVDPPIQGVTWHEDVLIWGVGLATRGWKVGSEAWKRANSAYDFLRDKADQVEQGRRGKQEASEKTQAINALEAMVKEAKTGSRPHHPSPLAEIVNDIARDTTGKDIRYNSSVEDIANQDPEYGQSQAMRYMREHEEPDGSVLLSLDELKVGVRNLQDDVNDQMTEMRGVLVEVAEQQQDILNWQLSEMEQQRRAEQSRQFEETLEQIDQAVSGVSALLKFIDPELGRKAEVVGKAAVQFAKAVNSLIDAVAIGANLASAAATGNMIGAAMQIVSLFASSGPSPEQLILEGIQDIKEQLQNLREEMHERFDIIDKKLNNIIDEMVTRFNRIDFQLGVLNDNVTDIQIALVGLQADLNRVEKNLFTFLDESSRQDLRLAINGWLGYHERTGMDMTYQEYSNALTGPENQFQTWATTLSSDQLRAGPNSRDYSDGVVLTELTQYPLHFNINYLSQFPAQRFGLPALSVARLSNPRDWAHSADAYRTLAEENRKYDQLINPARMDAIYNTGTALQAALKNITVQGSSANYPLFNALQTNYNNQINAVQVAIQQIEDTYYNDPDNKLIRNGNRMLDIYLGAEQNCPHAPEITNVSYPAVGLPLEPVGAILSLYRIPETLLIADYMTWSRMPNANIGRLSLALVNVSLIERFQTDPNWRIYTEDTFGDTWLGTGTFQYQYFKDKKRYVRPKIDIALMFQDNVIAIRTVTGSEVEAHRHRYYTNNNTVAEPMNNRRITTAQIESDTPAWISAHWDGSLRPVFESSSTEGPLSDPELFLRNTVQFHAYMRVEEVLRGHQIAFYSNILSDLDVNTNLQRSAKILTGAKELWIAYIALGMSRSLERDEQLRGLLFGDQSLLDTRDDPAESILHGLYNEAISLVQSGQRVPKVDIQPFALERSDTLHSLLTGYLNKIRDHVLTESMELVEVTLLELDLFRKTRYNPTIANVTPNVSITRDVPRFNRSGPSYTQRLTLRNTGNVALNGPITLILDKVGSNPVPVLGTQDGQTLFFSLSAGNNSPYLYVGVGADNIFSPGETATITVEFLPTPATKLPPYNTRVLAGEGKR